MPLNGTRIREIDLLDLLEGIDQGTIALPNFQRDFEWTDGEVRALIGTVLSGWPMGSLLVIEAAKETEEFYQPRSFEFAPELSENLDLIVLDGQQRLTSLYQAFYASGPSRFAVKMSDGFEIDSIDAVDSAIRSFKAKSWYGSYSSTADQWKDRMVPASSLRSPSDFFEWRDEVGSDAPSKLTAIYRASFSGLHRYRVPAVEVGTDLPPAAVARIFERVNRGGRRLGTFDLMVAKSFRPSFNLRVAWDSVAKSHPAVYEFCKGDGMPILTLIALRTLGDIRASSVLELTGSAIRDGFEDAVENFDEAVRFASENLGVLKSDWQPYPNLLVVLAGLNYDQSIEDQGELLEQWFWATAFSSRYAVASNTTAVSDYRSLNNGADPTPSSLILDRNDLTESSKQHNGALHRAILCWLGTSVSDAIGHSAASDAWEASAFARVVDDPAEPPLHLRSMGFALFDENSEYAAPAEQFLRTPVTRDQADSLFAERAAALEEFLRSRTGRAVRIVDADQLSAYRDEGESGD